MLFGVIVSLGITVPEMVEATVSTVKKHHDWAEGHREAVPDYDWWLNKKTGKPVTKEEGENNNDAINYAGWFTHDKKVTPTGTVCWFTKGFVVTPESKNEIIEGALNSEGKYLELWYPDYAKYAKSDVKNMRSDGIIKYTEEKCPKDTAYLDTAFLFRNRFIYEWGAETGAPIDDKGVMTVYMQPIIGIKQRNSATTKNWYVTDEEYRTLTGWQGARGWSNKNDFVEHYNKPLQVAIPHTEAPIKVNYVTMEGDPIDPNGDATSSQTFGKYNVGSKIKYTSTGMVEYFNGKVEGENTEYTWVLMGVEVDGGYNYNEKGEKVSEKYKIGTYGELISQSAEDSYAILNTNYKTETNTLVNKSDTQGIYWKVESTGNKSGKSSFYTFMSNRKFQSTLDTEITYYYARIPKEIQIYTVAAYKGLGENGGYHYETVDATPNDGSSISIEAEVGKNVTENINSIMKSTRSFNTYSWQATHAVLREFNGKLSAGGVNVMNNAWGATTYNFYPDTLSVTDWQTRIENNNKINFTPSKINQNYVYIVYYDVVVPQVELYYQKNYDGTYTLLEMKSDGKTINKSPDQVTMDDCTKKSWTKSVSVSAPREYKNLVLTEAYPIQSSKETGDKTVALYNGSDGNNWKSDALPVVGGNTFYGNEKYRYKAKNLGEAMKAAEAEKNFEISYAAYNYPRARIFVYIYEDGPVVTVRSVFSSDVSTGKLYSCIAPASREFTLGNMTKPMGAQVEYDLAAIGNTVVPTRSVLKQDGIGKTEEATGMEIYKTHIAGRGDVTCSLTGFYLTRDEKEIKAITDFQGGTVSQFAPLCNYLDGTIDLTQGDVGILKVFDVIHETGHWEVSYVDLENCKDSNGTYSWGKGNYQRLGDPELYTEDLFSLGEVPLKCNLTKNRTLEATGQILKRYCC